VEGDPGRGIGRGPGGERGWVEQKEEGDVELQPTRSPPSLPLIAAHTDSDGASGGGDVSVEADGGGTVAPPNSPHLLAH